MHNVTKSRLLFWGLAIVSSLLVTLALFYAMDRMISADNRANDSSHDYKTIEFVQAKIEEQKPEIKKELPPEPKPLKSPPKKVLSVEKNVQAPSPVVAPMPIMPRMNTGLQSVQGRPKVLSPMKVAKIDSALSPLVKVKPPYPSRARRMGIEGYVKVALEVDASGVVTAIKIVESSPKGVFDKTVKRTLRHWKFRPKTVDGKAIPQTGVLKLNFTLGE